MKLICGSRNTLQRSDLRIWHDLTRNQSGSKTLKWNKTSTSDIEYALSRKIHTLLNWLLSILSEFKVAQSKFSNFSYSSVFLIFSSDLNIIKRSAPSNSLLLKALGHVMNHGCVLRKKREPIMKLPCAFISKPSGLIGRINNSNQLPVRKSVTFLLQMERIIK